MAKVNVREKLSGFLGNVRAHWNTPKEGEYVSIKELLCLGGGAMGNAALGDVMAALTFSGTATVVGMIFGIGIRDVYVISIIGTIMGYLFMPLGPLITDNMGVLPKKTMRTLHLLFGGMLAASVLLWIMPSTRFDGVLRDMFKHIAVKLVFTVFGNYLNLYTLKLFGKRYGKFKPFLVLFGLPSLLLATAFTFIPYKEMNYSSLLLLVHITTNLIGSFSGPYTGNIGNLQGVITPNSQERTKIYAIMPMMLGLLRSIYGIIFPIIAQAFGGQLNIAAYRYMIPIIGGFGLVESFLIIRAKERVVRPKDFKPKVNMRKAAKEVFSNKYLWIRNISDLFGGFGSMGDGMFGWIMLYGTRMEWLMGILLNISYLPNTPGNLLAPWLTRRYSKRQAVLVLKGIKTLLRLLAIVILFVPNDITKVAIFLGFGLLHSLFGGAESVITGSMGPDIWDYQQWKSGERLEASMGLFGYFTTPVSMLLGFVTPYILKMFGLVRDWDIMFDPVIRNQIINVHIIISIFGMLATLIPYIFYDLTPDKMERIGADLRARAEEADKAALTEALHDGEDA